MGVFVAGSRVKASDLNGISATWSPTYTNLTIGSGTVTARYAQVGKWVDWYWQFIFGSGSVVGTAPMLTLPVTPASYYSTGSTGAFPGFAHFLNSAVEDRQGTIKLSSGSTIGWFYWNATPTLTNITTSAPWTWNAPDSMTLSGRYEGA